MMGSRTPVTWTWTKSYFRDTSFAFLRDIEDINVNTNLPSSATHYVNIHAEKLKEFNEHLSIAHLNSQPMSSIFDEFQVMINENQFDIVTLSETWLRDNKHLLDYIKIPDYKFVYKNREQKRGGKVGAYL